MIEICVIRTDDDGKRTATLLVDGPVVGVPFLYRYLRDTRRADAPPYFQFREVEIDEAARAWVERLLEADR